MGVKLSDSIKVGALRVRLSVPLAGRGRKWLSVGTRTPFGFISVGRPVGRVNRRSRSRV
jgi:hypothetical protein